MCGIAGIIRKDRNLNGEHFLLLENLKHRGPDGSNYFHDEKNNLALVHARLSIIDPLGGAQPMSNEAKTTYITYNGELYNFLDIKKELEVAGFVFKTTSDTEVILASYKYWGKDCLKKFRGMFSFCIADFEKRELFLARDHFGIKPLFYYLENGVFVFSSELFGITRLPFKFSYNLNAIDSYLNLQYINGTQTAYQQINKLAPAHSLTLSFDLSKVCIEPYWEFTYSDNVQLSNKEWLEKAESTIKQSVKAHLISDVPFGAFLSGGIDSTLVVTYMAEILNQPVKTFTIGFNNDKFSEIKYADLVAKKLGTEHHSEIVEPKALEILPELIKHYGEPFGDSSAIPTYYVSKLARAHVPMVLSGDGGDEAFLGYQSYSKWFDFINYKGVAPYKRPFHPLLEKIYPKRYPPRSNYQGWIEINRYLSYQWRKSLWRNDVLNKVNAGNEEFEEFFKKTSNQFSLRKAQYSDLKTYLPCDILTKVDRASMIHGLEVRTPLVDVEIWKLISEMPVNVNLDLNSGSGKLLLKEILRKFYPENFISRPKQGFSIPIDEWISSAEVRERINLLTANNSRLNEFFEPQAVRNLIKTGTGKWIWLLLVLDEWLKMCEDQRK